MIYNYISLISEVPLQTLLALKSNDATSPTASLTADEKAMLTKRCKDDIDDIVSKFNEILSSKTYFVGERISLADITIYATLDSLLNNYKELQLMNQYVHVFRWYMTIGHNTKVSSILPISKSLATVVESLTGKKLPSPSTSSTTTTTTNGISSSSGTVGNSTSTAATTSQNLSMTSKWSRGRLRIKELLANENLYLGQEITIKGWIRTTREAEKGKTLFVELTDGSTVKGLQLILDSGMLLQYSR